MKKSCFPLVALLSISALRCSAGLALQPNDMLAITGDSITAQHYYSAILEDYLIMCQPTPGLSVAQFGWAGETAPGFLARVNSDLYPFKPTFVTTAYGMNDGAYTALTDTIASTYRQAQTDLVDSFKKNGVRMVVIGSPKCVDTYTYKLRNGADAATYNQNLAALAEIDKEVAAKEGVLYADVYDITTATMQKAKARYGDAYQFAGPDGVHPEQDCSLVIAYAYLKALGCDGAIGTLTVDYAAKQATADPAQQIVSYQDGTLTVKSTRYPFCFPGQPDQPNFSAAAILKDIPFNDDLNRYLLVVKGLTTPKAKITWGATSKEFASTDLAKGINLAAEFLQNPFCDQFNQVWHSVLLQQSQDQILVESFLNKLARFKEMAPTATAALDQAAQAGIAQREIMNQAAIALVVPIQHTITIEPEP
jgi:lysophospholipase L1-like esterase